MAKLASLYAETNPQIILNHRIPRPLPPQDGLSRLHASRRVFECLKAAGANQPLIHHIRFPSGANRDEIVISTGSQVSDCARVTARG